MRLSPATMSKRMARLEAKLGVRLLHRTTRRLALTAEGEAFHADLVQVLRALAAAEERVAGARRAPAGPLRVSAPTSFGRLHIAPRLGAFLAANPDVALRLDLSDDYVDLLAGGIDVAVRIAAATPPGLEAHRLADNRRLLCAAPAYLDRHGAPATPADLARHHLLAATGQLPWRITDGARQAAIEGRSHVETNSSEVVRELALGGVGIAFRSLWDVADALARDALVPVLSGWRGSDEVGLYAVHPRSSGQRPAVRAFVDFLREAIDPAAWQPIY